MKRKCLLFVLVIFEVFLFCGCQNNVEALIEKAKAEGLDTVISRCIIGDDGTVFFYNEENPVTIAYYDEKHYLTEKISTGDNVLFIGELEYDYMDYSRFEPEDFVVLEKGSVKDITDEMLEPFIERGYVDDIIREKNGEKLDISNWQEVYYIEDNNSIRLKLPPDWEYEIDPAGSDFYEGLFAVKFKPKGEKNEISIGCCNSYGICGTGLTSMTFSAGPYRISASTYGSIGDWDMINIGAVPGNYDIDVYGVSDWYEEYKTEVENIFTTLVIAENIISYDEAFDIAYKLFSKNFVKEYERGYGNYSEYDECWRFEFSYYPPNSEKREYITIIVNMDGITKIEE